MDSVPEPNPVPRLTIGDIIQIGITVVIRLPWVILTTLLRRYTPWSSYTPPPLKEHLFRHIMTCLGNNLPLSFLNSIPDRSGTTLFTSTRYAHLQNQIYHPIRRPSFSGFWICRGLSKDPVEPRDADIVLLHCHGGAYVMGHPSAGAPEKLFLAELLSREGLTTAIFSLDYTLAPKATFPTQFDEAVAAYDYLTGEMGVSSDKIVVAGDSAGGHLALALLTRLHLRRQETGVNDKPGAAVLLSPWVNMHSSHPRVMALHWEERLFKISLDTYAAMVMPAASAEIDELYGDFGRNGETRGSWAEILPRRTFVSAGSEEKVFRYDIEDFVAGARADGAVVGLEVEGGRDHAWQCSEAGSHHSRLLAMGMEQEDDESVMPGYRRVAGEVLKMVL